MPTKPPSENEPHRHRPEAMVDRIVASSPGPDVLDVGIGTGKEARQFRSVGCEVLGAAVDAMVGSFTMSYTTVAIIAARTHAT